MGAFIVTLFQLCLLPFVALLGILLHLATSLQDGASASAARQTLCLTPLLCRCQCWSGRASS